MDSNKNNEILNEKDFLHKEIFWEKRGWKKSIVFITFLILFSFIGIYVINLKVTIGCKIFDEDLLFWIVQVLPLLLFFLFYRYKEETKLKKTLRNFFFSLGFRLRTRNKTHIIKILLIVLVFFYILALTLILWSSEKQAPFGFYPDFFRVLQTGINLYEPLWKQIVYITLWEEILFRAILLNFFIAFLKSRGFRYHVFFSLVISSILFATAHHINDLLYFSYLADNIPEFNKFLVDVLQKFLGGIALGYIYYHSGNLFFVMLVHSCFNVYNMIFREITDQIYATYIKMIEEKVNKDIPQIIENELRKRGCI